MDVKLTNLGKQIEECWSRAEFKTRELVARKHPASVEEEITFLFSGELRSAVAEASAAGKIEGAFRADLRQSIPNLDLDVRRCASGLVARVNLHGRWHEGNKSAADLGIVIMRPLVQITTGGARVEFRRDHATGLLAQAKLGRQADHPEGKYTWGGLTESQEELFPKRSDYYSLLLYRLDAENADTLRPFGWQLCRGHGIKRVQKWLRSDAFPEEIASSDVLRNLVARKIGTESPKIIETIIDPAESEVRSITLHIFWPDSGGPPPSLPLGQHHRERQKQQIRQS